MACPELWSTRKNPLRCGVSGGFCAWANSQEWCPAYQFVCKSREAMRLRGLQAVQAAPDYNRAALPPNDKPQIGEGGAVLHECGCD